jgi:excisionase family DNA binding protein
MHALVTERQRQHQRQHDGIARCSKTGVKAATSRPPIATRQVVLVAKAPPASEMGPPASTLQRRDALLLTADEAARVLGIGRTKLYELMRRGDLKRVRVDGAVRLAYADLQEYVAVLRNRSAPKGHATESGPRRRR